MRSEPLYKGSLYYKKQASGIFARFISFVANNKKNIVIFSLTFLLNLLWLNLILDWFPMTRIAMYTIFHPHSSAYMELYHGDNKIQHKWVPMDKISVYMQRAVVVAEDEHFYSHEGIDYDALKVAWEKNKRKGRFVAGGSTITMQLARNLFLSPKKSVLRKARELYIATLLERMLSKERIMELYLNFAEFGDGIYGVEAASKKYFKKSAKNLTRDEAAFLAAILPNPKFYEKRRTSRLQRRIDVIRKLI